MNKKLNKQLIKDKWYWWLAGLILVGELLFLLIMGEGIYASAHDNLELHVLDYHLLQETGAFFTHGDELPILNGISRDYFASELSLYTMLYILFPTNTAYILGYVLKTVIALFATVLLAKDIWKEKYAQYEGIVVLTGLAFGLLPLYPTFSFPFVSLPYLIWIVRKIWRKPTVGAYVLLFLYPLVSYFTFFGVFILGYFVFALLYIGIWKRKYFLRMLIGLPILTAGYVVCEYRLFKVMLFDSTETIRDTMIMATLEIGEVMITIGDVFVQGIFHADSVHTYFVLPVVILAVILTIINRIRNHTIRELWKEPLVLTVAFILVNSIIYGIYYFEPMRDFVEMILPPAKGLQFNRTVFFNPYLWYVSFFYVLKKLWDGKKYGISYGMALVAIAIVLCSTSRYNDLYMTVKYTAYEMIRQTEANNLTYGEFYSEDLFAEIQESIAYDGEKVLSYGLDPGIAAYSGFYTLDGCLSYYPLSYKEEFRSIIAPALEENESMAAYFDDWGARAYVYPASNDSLYNSLREFTVTDTVLHIDIEAVKALDGEYILSRVEISNEEELGVVLEGVYTNDTSPYTMYVYQVESEDNK
ncbi:MAG: DUF6044 family protein [Eubacteriales bacterium]